MRALDIGKIDKQEIQAQMNVKGLKSYIPQVILTTITVVMVVGYDLMPTKKFRVLPFDTENMNAYSKFMGDNTNNKLGVTWDKNNNPYSMSCTLDGTGEFAFCGIIFNFETPEQTDSSWIDLSGYDFISIEIEATKNIDVLRLAIRNENKNYYIPGEEDSRMFIQAMLRQEDFNKRIKIDIEELRVAEWWVSAMSMRRKHSLAAFDRVATIGFDVIHENPINIKHEFTIKEMTFEGSFVDEANWYLIILAMWVLFFIYQFSHSLYRVNQQGKTDRELLLHMEKLQRELEDSNTAFERDAFSDALTGIYNRRGFDHHTKVLKSNYEPDATHSLIFMDIDHFKAINDTHGHDEGDKILKTFCKLTQSVIRSDDIFVRWGGEEFVLLCPNTTPMQGYATAQKVRLAIASHVFSSEPLIKITSSFGVASFKSTDALEPALQDADKALYQAKALGRNRVITNH